MEGEERWREGRRGARHTAGTKASLCKHIQEGVVCQMYHCCAHLVFMELHHQSLCLLVISSLKT